MANILIFIGHLHIFFDKMSFQIFPYICICLFKIFIYIFDLLVVLVLSCSLWDLVSRPGIEPGLPALGAWSLSHRPPRKSLPFVFFF